MASTAGNSEEDDDFGQRRPDVEYYEQPPMPAVLDGTLVTLRITYDGVCVSRKDGPKEKRERTLALREMRGWKVITDPQGFRITLGDQTKLIFVGAEGGLLDHLMKQAVQAAIEEAKEQRGRGTGSQLNYVWDESKFETRFDQDPGFKFAVQQDAGDGVLSTQKKVVIMVQVTSPREIIYADRETKMVCNCA